MFERLTYRGTYSNDYWWIYPYLGNTQIPLTYYEKKVALSKGLIRILVDVWGCHVFPKWPLDIGYLLICCGLGIDAVFDTVLVVAYKQQSKNGYLVAYNCAVIIIITSVICGNLLVSLLCGYWIWVHANNQKLTIDNPSIVKAIIKRNCISKESKPPICFFFLHPSECQCIQAFDVFYLDALPK